MNHTKNTNNTECQGNHGIVRYSDRIAVYMPCMISGCQGNCTVVSADTWTRGVPSLCLPCTIPGHQDNIGIHGYSDKGYAIMLLTAYNLWMSE